MWFKNLSHFIFPFILTLSKPLKKKKGASHKAPLVQTLPKSSCEMLSEGVLSSLFYWSAMQLTE